MSFAVLAQATYISIESYRKNGSSVRTPVSVMSDDDKLFCWTFGKSGKVKRMRNNPGVKLAKCDAKGNVPGEWGLATARILENIDETKALSRRMAKKHGLMYFIFIQLIRLLCFSPAGNDSRASD